MDSIAQVAPAIGMLGAFACLFGGGYFVWTGTDRKRGVLMLVLSIILLANVLIWTL